MTTFLDYAEKYRCLAMRRQDGILELRLHTDGGPFQWGKIPHAELPHAFEDVARDRENRVVIVTGTGEQFSGPKITHTDDHWANDTKPATPANWDFVAAEGQKLISAILSIDVPMICAINGPVQRHAEIALLCDVILASETTSFEDTAHFHPGMRVPGDGLSIILTHLMGPTRARYFMLTGQVLSAQESKEAGLVAEIIPQDQVLPKAWAIARQIADKPNLTLRYTRQILTREIKRLMHDSLGYSLALEGLAKIELWSDCGPGSKGNQ